MSVQETHPDISNVNAHVQENTSHLLSEDQLMTFTSKSNALREKHSPERNVVG
jgi:hypothetical protein